MSGLFFLIAWILTISLLSQPLNHFQWATYVAVGGVSGCGFKKDQLIV